MFNNLYWTYRDRLTFRAQPSDGCASSMYTITKSATSEKSRTISPKSCNFATNGRQLELPKLTTRGRPCFELSRRRKQFFPSKETRGEL